MFKSAVDPQLLVSFLEINEQLNSRYFDLNGLFTQILESATQLTQGEASSLLLLQPETNRLEFVVALGSKGEEVKAFTLKVGEGIAGWVAQNNTSLHVPDVQADSRFFAPISKNVGFATKNILAVPLRVKGQCVGVVEMINKVNGGDFTEDDLTSLEIFANQAGLAIQNARSFQAMKEELQTLKTVLETQPEPVAILTQNRKMIDLLSLCRRYASTDSPVLITGENGTGKELVAEYIHQHSSRATGPLIRVNCAALPEALMESELFGHVKGAFTDAVSDRIGRFELAQGGTLFLDEIGVLPPLLQAKLLRVLQSQTMERVGGSETISVDIRIIAATNQDLEKAIEQGEFRQDLFYRLHVLPVRIPPLRERRDDIPLLAAYFLKEMNRRFSKRIEAIQNEAVEILRHQPWPGNIRQLQNTIERAVVLCQNQTLGALDFDFEAPTDPMNGNLDLKTSVQIYKAEMISRILSSCHGNQTKASQKLGIQRTYLSKLIKELNIDFEDKGALNVTNK